MKNEDEEYFAFLHLAESDMDEARDNLVASSTIEEDRPKTSLICFAIICYCRPFSSNRGVFRRAGHRLSKAVLPEELIEKHEAIVSARNEIIAHSDIRWREPRVQVNTLKSDSYALVLKFVAFRIFQSEEIEALGKMLSGLLPVVSEAIKNEQRLCGKNF